jgi:hypothetical protein
MDSTLPHFKDSRERLLDSYWTRGPSVETVLTFTDQLLASVRAIMASSSAGQRILALFDGVLP